jgi:HAE1 family hydrophobic/amphiphilic exporter-1
VRDAVQLMLLNNTDVNVNRLQLDFAKFQILRAFGPFDPYIQTSFSPTRSTTPSTTQLAGAQTLSSLSQVFSSTYSQTFPTGTLYQVTMGAQKYSSNSIFNTFNPYISSGLQIGFTQPLLRNRGLFVNRAPIVIAKRNLKQSEDTFEAQVNDAIQNVINQYWDIVQARKNMEVLKQSLDLAEASYQHDKRALELGALPPLDIYRSQQQVAQRKLQLIQAEYGIKPLEDAFRRTIGADLDLRISALDLDLEESAEPVGELASVDYREALQKALQTRPELQATDLQLENDQTNIRVANNAMKPDFTVGTFYATNGTGGNVIDSTTGQPIVVSRGGLLDSFDQLGSLQYPTYGLSLNLKLPLRNRAAEADLGSALASQHRTMLQRRSREQAIVLEVKNAINQLEQAKISITAAKLSRDLAQKTLQAEQRKHELGDTDIFFVLDAQAQLAAAEQGVVQAEIAYQRAVTAVDHAQGELISKNNVRLTH